MTQYWIASGDKTRGPFTAAQIKKLALGGKLKGNYKISTDKQIWVTASSVKGLEFSDSQGPRQNPSTTTGANAGQTSSQVVAPIVNVRKKKVPQRGSAANDAFLISKRFRTGTFDLIFGAIGALGVLTIPAAMGWDWGIDIVTAPEGEAWQWSHIVTLTAPVLAVPACFLVCFIVRVITFRPIRVDYFVKHRANGKLVVVSRGYWFFKLVTETENPWYKRLIVIENEIPWYKRFIDIGLFGSCSLQLYGPTVEPITLFSGQNQRKLDEAISKYENITGLSVQRPGNSVW